MVTLDIESLRRCSIRQPEILMLKEPFPRLQYLLNEQIHGLVKVVIER